MALEKAIKNLKEEAQFKLQAGNHTIAAFINLSIEALKVVETLREQGNFQAGYLLPGETENE